MKILKWMAIFATGFGVAFLWAHFARTPNYDLVLPLQQDVRAYSDDDTIKQLPQTFMEHFLSPWVKTEFPDIKVSLAMPYELMEKQYYDGHGNEYSKQFAQYIIDNAIGDTNYENKRGIMIMDADMRAIPSDSPMYSKPSHPTFGHPFDYAIYSRVRMNTPVMIMNESNDGNYMAVYNHQDGPYWVPSESVRLANDSDLELLKNAKYVTPTAEPLYLENGTKVHIGTLFPIQNNKPIRATIDGWQPVNLQSNMVAQWPMPFSHKSISEIAESMHSPYAWGGIDGIGRDCSQLFMEMFISFGLYMPRNSRNQINYFPGIDMNGMSDAEKIEIINTKAIPFETLIYFPGHIMLYIGTDQDGDPLVYHAIWGMRRYTPFFQETRLVIGKTIVSGTQLAERNWISMVRRMAFIGPHAE